MMNQLTTLLVILLILCCSQIESFEHKIDTNRCKEELKDTTCFVRGSCIETFNPVEPNKAGTLGDAAKLELFKPTGAIRLFEEKCDVIMQIKPYTDKKWHVMMQVKKKADDAPDLKFSDGIKFEQKQTLIECKEEKLDGELKPTAMGTNKIYTTETMFCSILIEADKKFIDIFGETEYSSDYPTITYQTDTPQSVKFRVESDDFWKKPSATCNPSLLVSESDASHEKYLLHEVADTTLPTLSCSNPAHKLIVKYENVEVLPDDLHCTGKKYGYKNAEDVLVKINDGKISVHCAEEYCSMCSSLQEMAECPDCTKPIPGPANAPCKAVSCTSDKWRQADGSVVESPVECRKSRKNVAQSGWFMTSSGTEIADGACSEKFDCRIYSKLDLTCDESAGCVEATVSADNATIFCPDGHELKVGEHPALSNITCDTATGLYKSGEAEAQRKSKVFCQNKPGGAHTEASTSGMSAGIAVGCCLLLLAIIIAVVVFFWLRRRRQAASKTQPPSMANTQGMKTAEALKSKECRNSNSRNSKSQSGSEPPPSTDIPSKEKMPDSNEKKEDKKEEKKEEKKDEVKDEEPKDETKEEKRASADKVKNLPRLSMDGDKKGLKGPSNAKDIERDFKQVPKGQPDPLLDGKKAHALDVSVALLARARNPGSMLKQWDEKIFEDSLIDVVTLFSEYTRMCFLRNLMAFHHYKPTGSEYGFGTLNQLFQVISECYERNLECMKTWEMIYRVIKLFCHYLPEKEAASVIKRMRAMMVKIAQKLIEPQGLVLRPNHDRQEHLERRELAMRILVWAEDPAALEELKKQGDAKPDDVHPSVQTAVYAHAIARSGKKKELEARFMEEIKERKEHPYKDEKFGTIRQHLIFALCADDKTKADFLAKMFPAPDAARLADWNPVDVLQAFRGATESCKDFDAVLKIFENAVPDDMDVYVDPIIEEYAKTADEKDKLTKQLKKDLVELLVIMAENCVSKAQFQKFYSNVGSIAMYTREHKREDFDSTKLQERAENLEMMLKDKKCIQWLDDALKKFEKK